MDETPEENYIEPTKSLFTGNPSAADDHAVAALEAITQVPAPYASTIELPEPEAEPEVEDTDESTADVETVDAEPEVSVEHDTSVLPAEDGDGGEHEDTPVEEPDDGEPADEPDEDDGSVEALLKKEAEITAKLEAKRKAEKRAVLDQIAIVARNYGLTTADIATVLGPIPSPSRGTKAPITHRDDQGNTWTGRGRTPNWLKGKNADDYRV